jgi:hypothetical protein
VFARRLGVYEEETQPLVTQLEQRHLLIRADVTSNDPDKVTHSILHSLAHFHEPNIEEMDAYRWLQFHEKSARFTQDPDYRNSIAKQFVEKVLFY